MSRPRPQWQLQALAAQRRDNELRRAEELKKVASYWEANTNKSRHHEQWTTEGYYERANKDAELLSEKKIKAVQLEERRKKLEIMLFQENMQYQQEIKALGAQPKLYKNGSYLNNVSTSTLKEINQGIAEKEDQLRRHEAELRLHHAWRLRQPELRAVDSYIATGKLKSAWMEQIVEKEVQKKKEEEETRKTLQERDEALRKEIAIEQEKIRDKELQMQELREGLESQIAELSEKEVVVKKLRTQEDREKAILEALRLISSEREREHARLVSERDAHIINMGLYKFKLKRRVLSVLKEIELDLVMLDKIRRSILKEYELEHSKHGSYKRVLDAALDELKEHRERERQRQRNIEVMYDGEARQINDKQDKLWAKEREARAALMNEVMKSLKRQLEEKIELSRLKQKENVLEREQILDQMDSFHQEVRSRERETKSILLSYSGVCAPAPAFESYQRFSQYAFSCRALWSVVGDAARNAAVCQVKCRVGAEVAGFLATGRGAHAPFHQHHIGKRRGEAGGAMACAGCEKPILDKFLLHVLERAWHAACVRCADCRAPLADKCYSRDNKLFCRNDFFRRYGTKCSGCGHGISPSDLVRKAREKVFHLNCFTCLVCRKQLSTGEELYVLDDNKFICKEDYLAGKAPTHNPDSLLGSGSDEEEEDESRAANNSSSPAHAPHPALHSELTHNGDTKPHEDSEDQGSLDGDPETRDSQAENKSPDDGNGGSKRRGPRTTIKAKQLEILKSAFSQTPKPTRHIREQLAKETGLPMRVIQVWFQNKRSKERRLKQLTSMGRGPFFGSSRKMRGFPMNLSPGGLEEGPPGFPYFATADGKFEFGYGPPFHHDAPFFHPPPSMPFNQPGRFAGGMEALPGGEFPDQFPPPDHLVLPRPSSPEFTFGDGPPPLHPEGLVW